MPSTTVNGPLGEREGVVPPYALTGEGKRENPPRAVSAKGGWRGAGSGGLVFELGIQASLVAAVLAATNEGGEDEYGDYTDGGAEEVRGCLLYTSPSPRDS